MADVEGQFRWVLLRHDVPSGPVREASWHYDWMIEEEGNERLVCFRVMERVDELDRGARFEGERLADHRREYLEYEGEISGASGQGAEIQGGGEIVRIGGEGAVVVRGGFGAVAALFGEAAEVELDEVRAWGIAGEVRRQPEDRDARPHRAALAPLSAPEGRRRARHGDRRQQQQAGYRKYIRLQPGSYRKYPQSGHSVHKKW